MEVQPAEMEGVAAEEEEEERKKKEEEEEEQEEEERNKKEEEEEQEEEEFMLWSVREAAVRQTLQQGASACGVTAMTDALQALGVAVTTEEVELGVQTRLRRNDAPLTEYLLSRSCAGATHAQLILGAERASGGRITGRFFPLHPPRRLRLLPWLAGWLRRGAVPVATMNMQAPPPPPGEQTPDAWHHQLVFGVRAGAVYMTNPLDLVSEEEMHQRLCSESVLLIRREDVLKRLTAETDLSSLEDQADPRWRAFHVEGQVRRMLREEEEEGGGSEAGGGPRTPHVSIPAAYSSGVTLFTLRDSTLGHALLHAPDLPLL